jgi:hypothetical protein
VRVKRYDYAVFLEDDTFLTNALLSVKQVAEMEARGYRVVLVRDTLGEGLPAFRGRRSVRRKRLWER